MSKNIAAVNNIINYIRSDIEEVPLSRIEDIDIDALELTISDDCKYFKKDLALDKLPEYFCIGSIGRNGNMIIPNPHTELHPGDELLLFIKEENISKAENLFT